MMTHWTLKTLLRAPFGLLGSAAAIAAAFMLVMLFEAVWVGEAEKIVGYIEHTDADVWVMQKGVSNMHMANSLLDASKTQRVAGIAGVAGVTPLLYLNYLVKAGGKRWMSYVVGVQETAKRGGPWELTSGRATIRRGETVIPDAMARLAGIELGDSVRIADKTLKVVGLSAGTFSMANPVTFVHVKDLEDIRDLNDYVSYILVKAVPGTDPVELAAKIRARVPGVSTSTRDDFARSDYKMAMQMGVDLIRFFTAIGTVLAALLVAFTLYTHTLRQRRELAIVKALGYRRRHLYASVVLQAAVLTGLGFVLATALAHLGIAIATWSAPQVNIHLTAAILAKVGLGGFAVALAATWVPARQIARIDPQSVFQS